MLIFSRLNEFGQKHTWTIRSSMIFLSKMLLYFQKIPMTYGRLWRFFLQWYQIFFFLPKIRRFGGPDYIWNLYVLVFTISLQSYIPAQHFYFPWKIRTYTSCQWPFFVIFLAFLKIEYNLFFWLNIKFWNHFIFSNFWFPIWICFKKFKIPTQTPQNWFFKFSKIQKGQ